MYPSAALAEGREGRVVLRVHVARNGTVMGAKVIESAAADFDQAAVAAMLAWRFEPAMLRAGVPTDFQVDIPVVFKLEDESAEQAAAGPGPAAPDSREVLSKLPPPPPAVIDAGHGGDAADPYGYVRACVERILRTAARYRPGAHVAGSEGAVHVVLSVLPSGELDSVSIAESSGQKLLDDALVLAIWMSAPFPALPEDVRRSADQLSFGQTFRYAGQWESLSEDGMAPGGGPAPAPSVAREGVVIRPLSRDEPQVVPRPPEPRESAPPPPAGRRQRR